MKSHTAKDNYEHCLICSKNVLIRHMESHMETHNKEKPFKCTLCEKAYSGRKDIMTHMNTAHFLDESECVICSKRILLRLMKSHMQYHSGENYYHCTECGKSFTSREAQRMHMKKTHNIDIDVLKRCHICLKNITVRNMDKHMKTRHLEF